MTDIKLPKYALEYNEKLDALASLELLVESLPKVLIIPHNWKWVILALHSSFQGFMVLALQGTNSLNVLTEKSAREWLKAHEEDSMPKKPPKLDDFMKLYSKIKSDAMHVWSNSRIFVPNSTQDESVRKLNAFRNDFIHYVPAISLLDMRIWARLILDIIPIIEFLVVESNNISFNDSVTEERVKGLCVFAKSEATGILSYYGA